MQSKVVFECNSLSQSKSPAPIEDITTSDNSAARTATCFITALSSSIRERHESWQCCPCGVATNCYPHNMKLDLWHSVGRRWNIGTCHIRGRVVVAVRCLKYAWRYAKIVEQSRMQRPPRTINCCVVSWIVELFSLTRPHCRYDERIEHHWSTFSLSITRFASNIFGEYYR